MKLSKGEFRLMIKECIRELINEGAFNQILTESIGNVKPQMLQGGVGENSVRTENPHLQNLIQTTTKLVTAGKPQQAQLYASLLEDTAKNTLQRMINGDTEMRGSSNLLVEGEETPVSAHEMRDLENLSGNGDMKRWAAIAMGGSKR
jgi:hypothetical protein